MYFDIIKKNHGGFIMKMRAPAIPLITVDPYFSVWSKDNINKNTPVHWTGKSNDILGIVTVDGEQFRFLGRDDTNVIEQKSIEIDAISTTVRFENEKIALNVVFTSPMLVTDLYYSSRPVSYMKVSFESLDGNNHDVSVKVAVSEELALNKSGEGRVWSENADIKNGTCIRMGNGVQNILRRCGDDVRIDWGYFYLAVDGEAKTGNFADDKYWIYAEKSLDNDVLFVFAYDDIDSIVYFGEHLKAYWKKDGKTIIEAIEEAIDEYAPLYKRCCEFSDQMRKKAVEIGNDNYAELVMLAYRQVMAAHKLVVDNEGNNLYISKECFSNGCAATVDVTYPSSPMYLYYNTELLKGMLRPVLKYSRTDAWKFDFAPHDVGCYPIVNGQVYGENALKYQMPVEECGNMMVLISAICKTDNDYSFARENMDLLEVWNKYLVTYGKDPDYQLCTDDFAGHLSHNCNLSLKAIMGMAGFADILANLGKKDESEKLMNTAKEYAESFLERSKNSDGSYRLAYDRPDTFSLKYNAVWDKLWNTGLFTDEFYKEEIRRYRTEALPYGVPLDSREKYTKSDWMHWISCFGDEEDFCFINDLLHKAYSTMRTRVPMTDWFYTDTSEMVGFQHRTVQGGLFFRFLF